jgi:hypothetical protein
MKASRRAVWGTVAAFSLAVLSIAWFVSNNDREWVETRGRPRPPALRNSWLATEMLLARFGYRAATSQEAAALDRLPGGGTVILSSDRQYHLTPSRAAALLAWVHEGGLLIADASGVSGDDPILKAFDVALGFGRSNEQAEGNEGDEGEDEGAVRDKPAVKGRPREPPLRIVDVPGYGRELRLRSGGSTIYPGKVEPAWGVPGETDKRGRKSYEVLAFKRGAGEVVLVNGLWRFGYRGSLVRDDHAELLLALIASHQRDGEVRIFARLAAPSLFEWLWDNATAFLASAGVLFLFWLWRIVPRFGVLRPDPPRPRRSLMAHLRAIGRFLWRQHASAVLLDAARANVKRRLVQRGLASPDTSAPSLAAQLSRAFGMSEVDIETALAGTPAGNAQYTAAMATLHDLSHKLDQPATH